MFKTLKKMCNQALRNDVNYTGIYSFAYNLYQGLLNYELPMK